MILAFKIRSDEILLRKISDNELLLNIQYFEHKDKFYKLTNHKYSLDNVWTIGADGVTSNVSSSVRLL